jgi:hypothetical protein
MAAQSQDFQRSATLTEVSEHALTEAAAAPSDVK